MNRRVLTTLLSTVLLAVHTAGLTDAMHLATAHADSCGQDSCHPRQDHAGPAGQHVSISPAAGGCSDSHPSPAECSTCRTLAVLHAGGAVFQPAWRLDLPAAACPAVHFRSPIARSESFWRVWAPRGPPALEA
ncbi:MAG: hypothetical protein ACLFUJ_12355 [Phycisphaerae bacterium]